MTLPAKAFARTPLFRLYLLIPLPDSHPLKRQIINLPRNNFKGFGRRISLGFLLSFICTGLTCLPGFAQQKQIDYQKLVWARYSLGMALSDRVEIASEIDERRYVFPGKQHQLLFRSTALYNLKDGWQAGAGFTYFLQSPHDPRSKSNLMVPELRPHQEINFRVKISDRWSLKQRFKMEERFFRKISEGELASGYNFNFRFRFKADLFYTILKDKEDKDRLYLILSDEVMFNAGEQIVYNVFDQNRVYGGFRWNTGTNTAVEAGYLWWFQQRQDGKSYYHRDILRLTFAHKVSFIKKEA